MWSRLSRISSPKILLEAVKQMRATAMVTATRDSSSSNFEERKIDVNGVNINYLKTGSGKHPVLLLPGSMGTIWTDFKPQIENLDKTNMTIVAWDPPGYGKSRPPDRTFPENFFERDAEIAYDLMKKLGYDRFSLIGWSDGGITSLMLAANHPSSVRKVVGFGVNSYILPSEMKIYESLENIDAWSDRMKAPLIAIYGEDYFRKIWSAWINAMRDIFKNKKGDICRDSVPRIQCPTLIIYGAKDFLVDPEHMEYLKRNIRDVRLKIFERGAHNLHLRYHEEFNELVTKFLLEETQSYGNL